MENIFYEDLKLVDGATHGLQLLAIGYSENSSLAEMKGAALTANMAVGWLNIEMEDDALLPVSSMTAFPSGKMIKLEDVFMRGGGRATAREDIRVGIVAFFNEDGLCVVFSMLLFVRGEAWKQQWRLYRTVSNAGFICNFFLAWLPQLQVFHLGEKLGVTPTFSGEASADLSVWMTSRENPSAEVFTCAKHEFKVSLFKDPADGATVTLDLYTGSISHAKQRKIRIPAGGILTGMSGSGKFFSLLRHMSAQGKPKLRRGAAAVAATQLRSPATLIVVPVAATQWRLRQIHSTFPAPKHMVVEILTHAQFDQATWADVLTADIVVVADSVFQSKWYTKHMATFLGNMYSKPEVAAAYLADMQCIISSKTTAASRRKRARLEAALAMSAEAELFFSQVVNAKGGSNPKFLHGAQGMVGSVSYQLSKAPAGWGTCFRRPVFQTIHFARVILADIQSYSNLQLDAAFGLAASVKWATDSCTTSSWMTQAARWDVVLEPSVRKKFDQDLAAKFALLNTMMSTLKTRRVEYTTAVDIIQPTLLDNLKLEITGKVTADDLVRPLHRNICLVSPEELVVEILLERERALLHACFGRCRVVITQEDIVIDHGDASEDSSASSGTSDDSSYIDGKEDENEENDDEDDEDNEDDEEGEEEDPLQEEKEDETAVRNSIVMDIRNYLMEFGMAHEEAPAQLAVAPPISSHVSEQVALARRLGVSLAADIGQQRCTICTIDLCNGFLSCGHTFCYKCIREWVDGQNTTCPFCMREFADDPPFYVPTMYQSYPLPAHCAAEEAHAWAADVCKPNLSSVAFWCLAAMMASERAGKSLVFLVDTDADAKNVAGVMSKWKDLRGTWACTAYTGVCVTRQRLENKFKAGCTHLIIAVSDVLAGCRLEGVGEVLSLCSNITTEVADALALRLGAIHIRSCVYSGSDAILL